jgi:hypothetical protein
MASPTTLPAVRTARANRGLFAYWVASGALLGIAAGTPWAWSLSGLLPAAVFGIAASILAAVLWRRPDVRGSVLLACVFGALVGSTLGRLGSFTWPGANALDCFTLTGGEDDLVGWGWKVLIVGGPGITGLITFGVVARVLRRRARWLVRPVAAAGDDEGLLWFAWAKLVLYASLFWSSANECLWPTWYGFIRNVCHPDVGPIAIVGYAFSVVGFVMARRRAKSLAAEVRALVRGEHAILTIDRSTRPTGAFAAWVRGDGAPGSDRPHDHPQDWSAVLRRPEEGAYRDTPGDLGFIFRDGTRAVETTRRRTIQATTYLAIAAALCAVQIGRTTNILVRQARWRASELQGSPYCVCDKGGGGSISNGTPLP